MGGRAAIDGVETIHYVYRFPDHGGPTRKDIGRPNLMNSGGRLVFDGERASFMRRDARAAEIVPAEEWQDFEMEIGLHFPAFFDYPASYDGVEVVDGVECHRLVVETPLGARLVYDVDTTTHLPFMVEGRVVPHGRDSRYCRRFTDYRDVDGVLLPSEFTYFSGRTRKMYVVVVQELGINLPLPEDHFMLPAGVNDAR
jgi:hypothetical protein